MFFARDGDFFFLENVKVQNIHNVVLNATCALAMESVQVTSQKPRGVKTERVKRVILVPARLRGFSLQSN